ncbi:hypothetical protein Tco_0125479 [Tanacetum coccineum]
MFQLPTDRAALDEYMAIWFRGEVSDSIASVSGREELISAEDLEQLGILNLFVSMVYGVVCKKERDVADMDY